MKQRISEILEPQSKSDFLSRSFNIFIISLIILNVLAVALETMRDVSELYAGPFKVFEWFSMAVFSIEYGLRVWTCTVKPEFSSPIRGQIRYMLTPSAIIDLVVVIPFYLPFFFDMSRNDMYEEDALKNILAVRANARAISNFEKSCC